MREIPLSRRSTAGVVAVATAVWCCDFLCLVCSFRAVHCGRALGRCAAGVRGSAGRGLVPGGAGGLGLVEGSLAVGAGRLRRGAGVAAVSAALAFRIVNFWLAVAVGWLRVVLIAQQPGGARRRSRY